MRLADTKTCEISGGIYEIADFFPKGVRAIQTTRAGGSSEPPFDRFNLGSHVGDDAKSVAHNRNRLQETLRCKIGWLTQVHGIDAVRLTTKNISNSPIQADAAFTSESHLGACVMVADCLPVLVCANGGEVVGAAHAGWRGLAGGVIESLLTQMQGSLSNAAKSTWHIWLGPCIGPRAFEVGPEVRAQFAATQKNSENFFTAAGQGSDRLFADLQGLAESRVRDWMKSSQITGYFTRKDPVCVYSEQGDFYSFRRDGKTGRMASLILKSGI